MPHITMNSDDLHFLIKHFIIHLFALIASLKKGAFFLLTQVYSDKF